jgi:hypothetical protein
LRPLGLVKLGVATNPKQRVQNLQIGSPVPLELAGHYAMSDRPTAEAVVAARDSAGADATAHVAGADDRHLHPRYPLGIAR